jgi:hypothetical protein
MRLSAKNSDFFSFQPGEHHKAVIPPMPAHLSIALEQGRMELLAQ